MLTADSLNLILAISEGELVEEIVIALLASPQLAVFFEKFPRLKHALTQDIPRWREQLKTRLKEAHVPPELEEEVIGYQKSQLLSTSHFIVQLPQISELLRRVGSPFADQAQRLIADNP
ncbi:hypothetical protein, partial [Neisseria gonorrhoeae]|uniref:hypothetical protein n=1 Tax=Neisseria gonorrhoeae TaxID=485 RepID=UPI000D4DCFF6